ncbi:MAG: dTDP-glucose 4,6-dehydratase [Spirochaetales bacterium]|nr:dTDP-glucose 4,6-dehydratase [Spirochaetales bacterium]
MTFPHLLITGGAGFIGSNFVYHALKSNLARRITVIDALTYAGNLENLSAVAADPRLTFQRLDITDRPTLDSFFASTEFTHVIHLAAESHVDRSIAGPEAFVRTNVLGTFHLLEAVRKSWSGALSLQSVADRPNRLFLHVSTDEVFGSLGATGAFTEETPYRPNSPYAASKAGSDHLARAYHHTYGLPVIISNCSNNFGPFQFPEKLIPLIILNCLQSKPLPVYGDGQQVRDWLFVSDHCRALALLLTAGRVGECYNIGGSRERTNLDLVRAICRIMDQKRPAGAPHDRLITFVADRPGHDRRYAINSSKIQSELGWQPTQAGDRALEETVDWYIENRNWWEGILSGEYHEYYARQYGA